MSHKRWLVISLILFSFGSIAAVGPVPSEAVWIAFVVAVLALIKAGDGKVYELPAGFYEEASRYSIGFYAVAAGFLEWFPLDLDIAFMEPSLVAATGFMTAVTQFIVLFYGSKLAYRIFKHTGTPFLGASKTP